MLILSRRIGEELQIGQAKVTVCAILSSGAVRIGVVAAKTVPVRRTELARRCTCEERDFCEMHGCKCAAGIHEQPVGSEIRCWCPRCNALWTKP